MADNFLFVQAPKMKLSGSGVTATATTITVRELKDPAGTKLAMTDFGDIGFGVLEPRTDNVENYSFTGITQNADGTGTFTGVTRGLKFVADYTASASLRKAHSGGTEVIISNTPGFYNELGGKDNDETITGDRIFQGDVQFTSTKIPIFDAQPTLTDNKHIATKKYADDIAVAGSPDAGTTTKGVIEQATITEISANAAAGSGSTTAPLAVTTDNTSNTSSAKQIIPVTDADGDIPVEFMELDAIWAYTGNNTHAGTETFNTTLEIADPTDWSMNSIAFAHTMTLINEGCTFFNATDMTGTEAETLSSANSSDASALHHHNTAMNDHNLRTVLFGGAGDGLTETTGAGTLTRNSTASVLTTAATSGDTTTLSDITYTHSGTVGPTWANSQEIQGRFKYSALTTIVSVMGLYQNGNVADISGAVTETGDHFGFVLDDGTMYATSADGTTQEKTDVTGALTLTNFNTFRAVFDAGTDVKFYANNTLVATHSTNIPTGALGNNVVRLMGVEPTAHAVRTMTIANNYIYATTI